MQEMWVRPQGWENPLEVIVINSSVLAWRIPWMEESGRLRSIALQRVGWDWSDWAGTHRVVWEYISLDSYWVLFSDYSHRIKYKNNDTAVLGENVMIFCNLTTPADVVQITWQKIQDSLPQNIGTYSYRYGEKILPPYIDRGHCKAIEPNSSFISIREATFEDEACYKCLFNVFPHRSHGGQICLDIISI